MALKVVKLAPSTRKWGDRWPILLTNDGDEGKEPSSLEPRVGAAVGVERCNLGTQGKLGDKGDEGKEPSSLGPRVRAAVGVERCNFGM
jgi:hypothetical protein